MNDISNQDVDDFLAHHGVKGMKWGVRRDTVGNLATRRAKRLANRSARDERFKSGTQTFADRFIRDGDLERTWKERKSDLRNGNIDKGRLAAAVVLSLSGVMASRVVRYKMNQRAHKKAMDRIYKTFDPTVPKFKLKPTPSFNFPAIPMPPAARPMPPAARPMPPVKIGPTPKLNQTKFRY